MFRRKPKESKDSSEVVIPDDPYIEEYVKREWVTADTDKSGKLDKGEIKSLLKKLNIRLKASDFEVKFKTADDNASGELDFQEFRKFLEMLRERHELKPLFEKYAKEKHHLNAQDLVDFLTKEQKEKGVTKEQASKIIAEHSHSEKGMMGYISFCDYVSSAINSAYNPSHTNKVYQDMTHPIPHYYIASSHNTYLMGHQLQGVSSTEAYAFCLRLGCRCVELDCWDGDNGEPIITHGHTIVSKITFRDVIAAIKEHAFAATPYPLTFSLENHCSIPQQLKMVEILKGTLGDLLPPVFDNSSQPLPSPEALKGKILIKGKKLKQDGASLVEEEEEEEEEEVDEDSSGEEGEKQKAKKVEKKTEKPAEKKKKSHHTLAPELSAITHFNSGGFGGFEKDKDLNPWDMSSFSELKVKKFYKGDADAFINHNNRFLSRTYPKGTRFDSSNFSPILSWALGCHMAALNYQTGDHNQFVNWGKFLDNGGCGYVLKPPTLLTKAPASPLANVTLKVVSGWQLPKASGTQKGEVIDSYVKVRVYGVGKDTFRGKTKVVNNNGFNPIWNETFNFAVERPDLAIVLFKIYDEDKLSKDDFIAYSTVPITSFREGHRSLQLYNTKGEAFVDSSLLLQISF